MTSSKETIYRAITLLERKGIDRSIREFLFYASFHGTFISDEVSCERLNRDADGFGRGVEKAYRLSVGDGSIIIALSHFSRLPFDDDDDECLYGDLFVQYEGEIVLEIGIQEKLDRWGSGYLVNLNAYSLRAMVAGPWLDLLPQFVGTFASASKRDEEIKRVKRESEHARRIILNDYL